MINVLKLNVLVCLMLNVLVNNFSVMLGQSNRFPGITNTLGGGGGGGVNMTCSGHNTVTRVGLKPPTSGSGFRGVPSGHHPSKCQMYLSRFGFSRLRHYWTLAGSLPYQRLF